MARTWLITGGSRGFGRALCERILEAGDNLLATARDPAQLGSLAGTHPDQLATTRLDVTRADEAEAAVAAAIHRFGALDVLVNNAGYGDIGSVEDTGLDSFRRQIETNLFGTILMTKAVIPHMRTRRSGHIIQFSSVGGRLGAPGRAADSGATMGLEGV